MIKKIKESILLQLLCIIILILLIITATFAVTQHYIESVNRTNSETLCESLLKRTDDALSLYEDGLRYQASYLCRFLDIDELSEMQNDEKEPARAEMLRHFSKIASQSGDVVSIMLFDRNMHEVMSLGKSASLPEGQRYMRSEEDFDAGEYLLNGNDYNFAYYYPVYGMTDGKSSLTGMCVFVLDHWNIDGTVRNILEGHNAMIVLSDPGDLSLSVYSEGRAFKDVSMDEIRNDSDCIYREGVWENGIRVAAAVSVSANTEDSRSIRIVAAAAFSIAVILLLILIYFSYFRMARPINRISGFIDRAIDHPEDRLAVGRMDDIGVVASSLNHMLDENQRMIQELKDGKIMLYETQLMQQKMEILAYRNQINPHFLYNTLSCMRDMALIHDEEDIADMAMALSDIFRYAVKGSNIVTFADEVQYMEKYASIINYRFSGKISIVTEVAEDVLDKPAIRFLLQPLVENSVFHGLEGSLEPGTVSTRIRMNGGRIEIAVEDNGIGMDAETLEKARGMVMNPPENSSIGLSNIAQRLRLFYGRDYTLDIDSEQGRGTRIVISLPDHIKA